MNPPYSVFYKDEVQLRPHPKFLSKVVSDFYLNQSIYLLMFFPKPRAHKHVQKLFSVDVHQAVAFYLERTKSFPAPMPIKWEIIM